LNVAGADEEDVDLSLQVNDEGEIYLENFNGAVYDDTKYDTFAAYSNMASHSTPSAPIASPDSSYVPNAMAQQQQSQFYQPPSATVAPPYQPTHAPAQQHHTSGYAQQQHPPASVATRPIFLIQVPATGVSPGMQLQCQNPVTGQPMIVTVPPGVGPGGKFAVQY
jgi:hypothetical protein